MRACVRVCISVRDEGRGGARACVSVCVCRCLFCQFCSMLKRVTQILRPPFELFTRNIVRDAEGAGMTGNPERSCHYAT